MLDEGGRQEGAGPVGDCRPQQHSVGTRAGRLDAGRDGVARGAVDERADLRRGIEARAHPQPGEGRRQGLAHLGKPRAVHEDAARGRALLARDDGRRRGDLGRHGTDLGIGEDEAGGLAAEF